jgi:hypothetical protein
MTLRAPRRGLRWAHKKADVADLRQHLGEPPPRPRTPGERGLRTRRMTARCAAAAHGMEINTDPPRDAIRRTLWMIGTVAAFASILILDSCRLITWHAARPAALTVRRRA